MAARAQRSAPGGGRAGHGADRVVAGEEWPAARRGSGSDGGERGAGLARRDAAGPARQAAVDPERPVEGALRQQERAAEEAGHRAQARPAARRRRTRADPAPRAQAEEGNARSAGGCARLSALRQALCRQWRAVHHPLRNRSRGIREHDRPAALPPDLRLRLLAAGSDRAAGARLFDNTPYGISVWVCLLYERFVCCRPCIGSRPG